MMETGRRQLADRPEGLLHEPKAPNPYRLYQKQPKLCFQQDPMVDDRGRVQRGCPTDAAKLLAGAVHKPNVTCDMCNRGDKCHKHTDLPHPGHTPFLVESRS